MTPRAKRQIIPVEFLALVGVLLIIAVIWAVFHKNDRSYLILKGTSPDSSWSIQVLWGFPGGRDWDQVLLQVYDRDGKLILEQTHTTRSASIEGVSDARSCFSTIHINNEQAAIGRDIEGQGFEPEITIEKRAVFAGR